MRNYKELLFSLILGLALGVLAKYLDTIPMVDHSLWHRVGNYLGDLFTRLGIWVFIATIIAIKSKNLLNASLKILLFFAGMLTSYYLYSAYLFGFFPKAYFIFWGRIALVSPVFGALVYLAKHDRKFTKTLPALPLGLMIYLSLSFGYLYLSVSYLSEFIMLLVMGKIFYRQPKQLGIVISLAIILALLLKEYSPFAF